MSHFQCGLKDGRKKEDSFITPGRHSEWNDSARSKWKSCRRTWRWNQDKDTFNRLWRAAQKRPQAVRLQRPWCCSDLSMKIQFSLCWNNLCNWTNKAVCSSLIMGGINQPPPIRWLCCSWATLIDLLNHSTIIQKEASPWGTSDS